jgi:hypothetical protein
MEPRVGGLPTQFFLSVGLDVTLHLLAEIRRLTGTDPLPRTIAVVMGITEPFPLEVISRFGWRCFRA